MTPEQMAELRQRIQTSTIVGIRRAQSVLMIIRVKPDFPLPVHKPGQYSTLGLGAWEPRAEGCQEEVTAPGGESKLIRRAYSISCSILDDEGKLLDRTRVDWLE